MGVREPEPYMGVWEPYMGVRPYVEVMPPGRREPLCTRNSGVNGVCHCKWGKWGLPPALEQPSRTPW